MNTTNTSSRRHENDVVDKTYKERISVELHIFLIPALEWSLLFVLATCFAARVTYLTVSSSDVLC